MKQQYSALKGNLTRNLQDHHDFTGRDLYLGIDVHKERWQVAVYYQGLILSNNSITAGSETFVNHLRSRYGELASIVFMKAAPAFGKLTRAIDSLTSAAPRVLLASSQS